MFFFSNVLAREAEWPAAAVARVPGTATGRRLELPAVRPIVSHEEWLQLGH
jgi:hypothetical protein